MARRPTADLAKTVPSASPRLSSRRTPSPRRRASSRRSAWLAPDGRRARKAAPRPPQPQVRRRRCRRAGRNVSRPRREAEARPSEVPLAPRQGRAAHRGAGRRSQPRPSPSRPRAHRRQHRRAEEAAAPSQQGTARRGDRRQFHHAARPKTPSPRKPAGGSAASSEARTPRAAPGPPFSP